MIYRQLDNNGDYQLGLFLQNSPQTVGQAILTRLSLWRGEWFMDIHNGTPYLQYILGRNTNYDMEIKARILETKGVMELIDYASSINNRSLIIQCTINTIYGVTQINTTL